ncbi:hypothetical protein ACTTV5_004453 [Vibrio parahaemolyticus]
MKKVRGSYMVEMVLVAGIMASLDTVQPSSHVNKETAEKFSAQ